MRPLSFVFGGIEIPMYGSFQLAQNYERIGGWATLRAIAGKAYRQTNWQKWKITTSGTGTIPLGLSTIDYTTSQTMKCCAPMALQQPVSMPNPNVFTIPLFARTDVPLEGYAVTDTGGELIQTPHTEGEGLAILTLVAGATAYRLNFWPEFTVYADPPSEANNKRESETTWSLTAEEA